MVKFYIDKTPNKKGEVRIRVATQLPRGGRLLTSTGYNIKPDDWLTDLQQAKEGTQKNPITNAKGQTGAEINASLAGIRIKFGELQQRKASKEDFEKALKLESDRPVTPRVVKRKDVVPVVPGEPYHCKQEHFDEFVTSQSVLYMWDTATRQRWHAFAGHMDTQGVKHLNYFDDGGAAFVLYLRNTCQLSEVTVRKHYANAKQFLNWCVTRGYYGGEFFKNMVIRPHAKSGPTVIKKPVIFLDTKELQYLYDYVIPGSGTVVELEDSLTGETYKKTVRKAGALAKARDLFCFCAFTSLRYSDMAHLRRSDVKEDRIEIVTQKTDDKLTIPLNNYSRAILKKYEAETYRDGRALPVISNQKMNDYIKDLCELCGFNTPITRTEYRGGRRQETTRQKWELMGTHAARRSFICTALAKGIPPTIVMKYSGHKDFDAMKPYIDVASKDAADYMQRLNTL